MLATTVPISLLAHAGHAGEAGEAGGPNMLVLLLAALPFVAGCALVARSRDAFISTVVLFSAAAGFVHSVVTPGHFREGLAVGLFTMAVTVGQMAVVVAGLNRPSRALWLATAAGNAAVLAIWALSRTTGLPVGPEPWTAEPVGFLDLACGAYEVAIIAGCLWVGRTAHAPAAVQRQLLLFGGTAEGDFGDAWGVTCAHPPVAART